MCVNQLPPHLGFAHGRDTSNGPFMPQTMVTETASIHLRPERNARQFYCYPIAQHRGHQLAFWRGSYGGGIIW